jgi:cytochrome c biogenesis protein CcdA
VGVLVLLRLEEEEHEEREGEGILRLEDELALDKGRRGTVRLSEAGLAGMTVSSSQSPCSLNALSSCSSLMSRESTWMYGAAVMKAVDRIVTTFTAKWLTTISLNF